MVAGEGVCGCWGGHACLWRGTWLLGGMCGCQGGVWWLPGGMCGCGGCVWLPGGHAWLQWEVHGCGGHAWLPRGVVVRGACVVARGHAWLPGGMRGCWGACVVAGGGGMHGCWGHVWLPGACIGYDEIRSMSGRYASYWNAFLFIFIL